MNDQVIDTAAILQFFTGKGKAKAEAALADVVASQAAGEWLPKTSHSAYAALTKPNRLKNASKPFMRWSYGPEDWAQSEEAQAATRAADAAATFGYYPDLQNLKRAREALPLVTDVAFRDMVASALDVFEPLFVVMAALDAVRPKPVFTFAGVSATVHTTLSGMCLVPSTLRVCPMEWRKYVKDGQVCYAGFLVWPEGTRHGVSRMAGVSNAGNGKCDACGHAIKNPTNWVPLVLDDADGVPHSMWVGHDCAKNIFGIEVKGVLETV